MIQREIDIKKPLTKKQKDMLKALEERPLTPDCILSKAVLPCPVNEQVCLRSCCDRAA